MDLSKIVQNLNKSIVVKSSSGPNKYKIIKSYANTYIADQMKKEERLLYDHFRVFEAAKPATSRKLNIDPRFPFDSYNDSLMDYASIISYKLKKPWFLFNRLISVQIPECPNECWHCYLPHELFIGGSQKTDLYKECTAEEIIDSFISQKEFDFKSDKYSNVLRITGGEPFIAPKLLIECLEILRDRGLENHIFLWTETNLEPFIGDNSFMDLPENKEILDRLKKDKYVNFLVHPCFHGLDPDEFNNITGREYNVSLEDQINALKKLVAAGIDLYPTIGSNVCNPANLERAFNLLMNINNDSFPLRTALIEYDLERYPPVRERLISTRRRPKLYSKFAALRIWNELLVKNYGIGYGILPRHLSSSVKKIVENNKSESHEKITINQYQDELIYLFKASYRKSYHKSVLEAIAYPNGHIYELTFDKKWAQEDLLFHINLFGDAYKHKTGILLYADKKSQNLIPLREFELIEIEIRGKQIYSHLKLGDYIIIDKNSDSLKDFNSILKQYFGDKTLPLGGKYLLIGENLFNDKLEYKFKHPEKNYELNLLRTASDFDKVVSQFTENDRIKNSIFYKVDYENLQQADRTNKTIYIIRKGENFKIKIEIQLPDFSNIETEFGMTEKSLKIEVSHKDIVQLNPKEIFYSIYAVKDIEFGVKKTTNEREGTITIKNTNTSIDSADIELCVSVQD